MELKDYLAEYSKVWGYIKSQADPDGVSLLAKARMYTQQPMLDTLDKLEMVYLNRETFIPPPYDKVSKELGLFTDPAKTGKDPFFLLTGRYVVPIKDISGNVIALVGWAPDSLKYVTTAAEHFSKATMFFGMETLCEPRNNGMGTWVVEGIFDRIAIESLGGRAYATMGINTDVRKNALYSMMGRIVGVPDGDTEGRKVVQQNSWELPIGSSYFRWKGFYEGIDPNGKPFELRIKDVDDLNKLYDHSDMKELFADVSRDRNVRHITRMI